MSGCAARSPDHRGLYTCPICVLTYLTQLWLGCVLGCCFSYVCRFIVVVFGLVSLALHCFLHLSEEFCLHRLLDSSLCWFLGAAGLTLPSPCNTPTIAIYGIIEPLRSTPLCYMEKAT